jgi:hypothetical protein
MSDKLLAKASNEECLLAGYRFTSAMAGCPLGPHPPGLIPHSRLRASRRRLIDGTRCGALKRDSDAFNRLVGFCFLVRRFRHRKPRDADVAGSVVR